VGGNPSFEVALARPDDAGRLLDLFEQADCRCYCRYYHFDGDKNEWLDRCYNATEQNARELEQRVRSGSDEAQGIIATIGAQAVGWLKVVPAVAARKAYEQRFYRGLPCFGGDRHGVFLIGCALVHPAHRRLGVARAMVAHAVEIAPSLGARALEAIPRRPREPVTDEELWTVPAGAFRDLGFEEVSATDPYPVLRCTIG
jgi:GNAT superfamily N-acetyltransferase